MTTTTPRLHVQGSITVPGDKSITHRALMLAAAARGESRLRGLLAGADCRSTAEALRRLGVAVPPLPADGGELRIRSSGLGGWRAPAAPLDCGNSGTTARLLMGLLAGRPLCAVLTGDDSLRARPMRRITDPLQAAGARVEELERADRLPLRLCGGVLQPLDHHSPKASAQIKSAVLLAGLSAGVPARVVEPIRSRDHTERMLAALGVEVHEAPHPEGWEVALRPPGGALPPLDLRVPGDFSSAAFVLALALLADAGELVVRGVGVNPTRTGLLPVLQRMGAALEQREGCDQGGEQVADLVARPGPLRATTVDAAEVPAMIDEIPVLAALAARAEGTTHIRGAAELRAKESDRIAALAANLRALGVVVEEHTDGLSVTGTDRPLRGRVQAHHDHRIAMAFGVLAALPGSDIEIDHPEVVDVSYPGYWEQLQRLQR